jgi:hypothetical protein
MASANLELCYLTATEALARFRARTLSPLELLDALIARSEDINPPQPLSNRFSQFQLCRVLNKSCPRFEPTGRQVQSVILVVCEPLQPIKSIT